MTLSHAPAYDLVAKPGLGGVDLLAPFVRVGDERRAAAAAPSLGADTDAVLAELG